MALYRAADALGVAVEVVAAYDAWPRAVTTYQRNTKYLRHSVAQVADVKAMARADLPSHDLVIGGPPCQPFSDAGKRKGHDDPRNCIPDFVRLTEGVPYVMENVKPRLLDPYRPGYWSERFSAEKFGDVTARKRWFYSSHMLQVILTPGMRRFHHIRDVEADHAALERASRAIPGRKRGDNRGARQMIETTALYSEGDLLSTVKAHDWHGYDYRSAKLVAIGQSRPTQDSEVLGTLTSGKGGMSGFMKVAMRGHGSNATEIAEGDVLSSVTAESTHALPQIAGVRCVSLLEMQRAHSFPEDFDWGEATKSDRGKMIANSVPIGLGSAILRAMLIALGVAQERAA
jgi:site-specific DNA-cytosine methylase